MKVICKRIAMILVMAVLGVANTWADGEEWSIDFSDVGTRNSLTDKTQASISAAVSDNMGTVTLGEALNTNFGIQVGSTWLYRTGSKGLYSNNGGNRNFGVFNAKAGQTITLNSDYAPTPTNATLKYENGNERTYIVNADGTVTFNIVRYSTIYSIKVASNSACSYTVHYVDADGNKLKDDMTGVYDGSSTGTTVVYPQNILKGTTLYTIAANTTGGYYSKTFTPDKDNYEVTISYSNATIDNVVYYTEGEDISGITTAENETRASSGHMGHTADADTYVTLTTLPAGSYKVYWRCVNGNNTTRNANIKIGSNVAYSFAIESGTNVLGNSQNLVVSTDGTTVSLSCEGSSISGVDWLYIEECAPLVTFGKLSVSEMLANKKLPFTVNSTGKMKIDGGKEQTCKPGTTYYALSSVETWSGNSSHETYSSGYESKPFAVWVYQDGYVDSGITPDGTKVSAILNGLKEQYNVLMVHGDNTKEITDLCPNIAKADLVVLSEILKGGAEGVVLGQSFKESVLNKTNFLNFKIYQYTNKTNRWAWASNIDKIPSTTLSATPVQKALKVFDGLTFNDDNTISFWNEDAKNDDIDHLHAVNTWLSGAPADLKNSSNTLLTATNSNGDEESVLHFYKDATSGNVYVGFGLSVNDYTEYNSNVTTLVSNIGKMIKAGTALNDGIISLEEPVITGNEDGSATITCSTKMATVYYSTTNTDAAAIVAEGVSTKNNLTTKFSSTYTKIKVHAVAELDGITSEVAHKAITVNNSRTLTRTVAEGDDAVGTSVVMTYNVGDKITVPYNQSYKKEGYSVKKWVDQSDRTVEYIPGRTMTITDDIVLEAVWTQNTKKITDLRGATGEDPKAVFHFLHKDGAASMAGTSGVLVGQVKFSATEGDFIDVACQYEIGHSSTCPTDNVAYDGKFNNIQTNSIDWSAGTTKEYAQVKTGTMFKFPAVYGMKVNYKPIDLDQDNKTTIHRTYVSFSQLKDGKLENPAFTEAQAKSAPVKGSFTDNYAVGGNFSYTGGDETAEFTSIESAVAYTGSAGQSKSTVLNNGTLEWNNGSGFFESLSVTYPALYTVKAEIINVTGDRASDEVATTSVTDMPGNTDGKFAKGMDIEMNIRPVYPYAFYYVEGLTDDEMISNVKYNYTIENDKPKGEYDYATLVDTTKTVNYGGSLKFNVTGDRSVSAYVKLLDTYEIKTGSDPFRSGVVSLPDDRTDFVANNLITLTAKPKVGYTFEKWVDGNGNDLVASATGAVREIDNEAGTLKLLVTKTSAAVTYVAKFKAGIKGTVNYDLSKVPSGTIVDGFPSSETNTAIVIPQYYTLYKKNYTLDHWIDKNDNTKTYEIGKNYEFASENESRTIQPVFTDNKAEFNYRTTPVDITWDFRTAYNAQKMQFGSKTEVYYSTHATINQDTDGNNGVTLDVPLVINTGSRGSIDNTNVDDWCTLGEGTTVTIPSGLGATFTLASYSPITSTKIDDDILTTYTKTTESGVDVYLYTYTTKSAATSVTLTIGDDYSYYKYIRAQLPSADKVSMTLAVNDPVMGSVSLASAKVGDSDSSKDATATETSTGNYTLPLGTYVKVNAYRNSLYEFDHWEINGTAIDAGTEGYTVTKAADAGKVDPETGINATVKFRLTSYTTEIEAVYKAREQYHIDFTNNTSAQGIAPSDINCETGASFTMPSSNQTLFYSGQTLKYWQDASGNKYEFGKDYTPTADLTLTPVFEPNEFTLVDIKDGESATATWNLAKNDGACTLNYHNTTGIYVTQVEYGGKSIDVPLTIQSNSASAGISNQSNDAYCEIDNGVIASVVTTQGCSITLDTYKPLQTALTTTSIAGATSTSSTSDAEKYKSGYSATVVYNGQEGNQDIVFSDDVQAFTSVSVTYRHINVTIPSITGVVFGGQSLTEAQLKTLNDTKTVSGISINPTEDDELPTVIVDLDNGGVADIIQPTVDNPTATIAVRTSGGILVGTYDVNFTVNKPTDAPVLESVSIDGVEATKTSDLVWTYNGTVSPAAGVIQLTFSHKMKAFSYTLKMHYGSKEIPIVTLTAESGKTLNCEYFDANPLVYGKTIPVGLSRSLLSDVYGNKCADNGYYTIYITVANSETPKIAEKKVFNFVVTHDYDKEYVTKEKTSVTKHQLVDNDVIKRLKAAGISYGTIDEGITLANKASGSGRYYIFVPDGSYQLKGNKSIDVTSSIASHNKDGEKMSTGKYVNGLTQITRSTGNVSLIGQSQNGAILWNNPYFYGSEYTSTIEIGSAQTDTYLQDITLDNRYSKFQVDAGQTPEDQASALYDRGYRTILKNVSVLGYQGTFNTDASKTADKNGRSYYESSTFAGTVDFISGDGNMWFEDCNLLLRYRRNNNITTPSSSTANAWGYVFNNCSIDAYSDDTKYSHDQTAAYVAKNFTLGRPWKNSPAAIYLNTKMSVLPLDRGWRDMTPNLVLRFGEYNTTNSDDGIVDLSVRSISLANPASGSLNPVMAKADAERVTLHRVIGGGEGYDPTVYTEQRPAVDDIGFDDEELSWKEDDYALCYFIFRATKEDGEYKLFTITTEAKYDFSVESSVDGYYIVRAANLRGGLGIATDPVHYTAPRKYTLTLSSLYKVNDKSVGWSTICLPFNAKVPSVDSDGDGKNDVIVYAAKSIKDNTVTLKQVSYINGITDPETGDEVDPVGYIVYGASGSYNFIGSSHSAECKSYLNGNPKETAISATDYSCYTLAYKPNVSGIGFYKFTGKTLAAYKAWLDVSTFTQLNESSSDETTLKNNAAKSGVRFVFEDDDIANGIRTVTVETNDDIIYDVSGARVLNPLPGRIYIINGEKVLWK